MTGGWPKLNEKVGVGAGAGDELEEDAFGLAVLAGDEVEGVLFAALLEAFALAGDEVEDVLFAALLFFACSERAWLSFLRCVLAKEFRAVNPSAT